MLNSFQNLALLQNLYRLKALGFQYSNPIVLNRQSDNTVLSNDPQQLHEIIHRCHLCDLSKSRAQSMGGTGNSNADVMFVDAYVSIAEDQGNHYFAGRSGNSLASMIKNVLKLRLEDVFVTHVVKCKPLGSNTPSPSEVKSCKPYLFKQIELIKPRIIVTLGPDAYHHLSGDNSDFEQVRGHKITMEHYILVPLYHPQYLLRNPSLKKETLHDLQTIKSLL